MEPSSKLLTPSGLNNQCIGSSQLTFADYILKTRQMLRSARADLSPQTEDAIIDANSPFEWYPTPKPAGKIQRGVLLVHGLFDCPFMVQDIGRFYQAQGFLVRAILLPGHGTVPADLLHIGHQEWSKAVDYGVDSLAQEVEEVSIAGFSLGGVLAVQKALQDDRIKNLLLIAPALKLRAITVVRLMAFWRNYFNWLVHAPDWYLKRPEGNFCKYNVHACNAPIQLQQVIDHVNALLESRSLDIPIFLVASAADFTISTTACLEFFAQHHNPSNRCLLYTSQPYQVTDPRLTIRNSYLPEQQILDFSHPSLLISPDNLLFGHNGQLPDFMHYPSGKPPMGRPVLLGETSAANLANYAIQRLGYNPDFTYMVEEIGKFLQVHL
jgi:esterase/lipase